MIRALWQLYTDAYRERDPILFSLLTMLLLLTPLVMWVLAFHRVPGPVLWVLEQWNLGYSLALFGVSLLMWMLSQSLQRRQEAER